MLRSLPGLVVAGFLLSGGRLDPPMSGERGFAQVSIEFGIVAIYLGATMLGWRWPAAGAGIMVGAAASLGVASSIAWAIAFAAPVGVWLAAGAIGSPRPVRTNELRRSFLTALATTGLGAFAVVRIDHVVFGPKHPSSKTAAPTSAGVGWAWVGGVTTERATVVASLADPRTPLVLGTRAVEPVLVDGDVARYELTGLEPGTEYRYELGAGAGRFCTFPIGPASFRVAVGGDARLRSNGAVFDTIRGAGADLYLINGDFFYADIADDDPDQFKRDYATTLSRPAQAALYREVPIAYMWDDHDFGPNDAHADSASRPAAQRVYRSVVPHYPLPSSEGIHQAFSFGRVRFVLTDGRSYRTDSTMLGADQLAWLAAELESAADEALVVLVVGSPWIAEPQPGADHWGGYPEERAAVADLAAQLDRVLVVSGDAHMLAVDDGSNSPGGFPVFHAAALDKPGTMKGGPYSQGAHPGPGQFGTIDVTDDGSNLGVTLTGWNWKGEQILRWELPS